MKRITLTLEAEVSNNTAKKILKEGVNVENLTKTLYITDGKTLRNVKPTTLTMEGL